jgi:hypothetical protein
MVIFRKANNDDTNTVINLYEELINAIKNNEHTPQWEYGVYPKDKNIIEAIENGVGVKKKINDELDKLDLKCLAYGYFVIVFI